MCKGFVVLEWGYRSPVGHSLDTRYLRVLSYGSTEGNLRQGKDLGKPLGSCDHCGVPGGSSQQKPGEGAVRQQL